jgi:hypothetical protein
MRLPGVCWVLLLIALPLSKLTKKDKFTWTEARHKAFDKLQECFKAPILSPP